MTWLHSGSLPDLLSFILLPTQGVNLMDEKEHAWHRETVGDNVERTLGDLQAIPVVARFYLAGGTGLALQLGHRRSVDLDFFLGENFDVEAIVQKVQQLNRFSLVSKSPGTIYA